MNARLTIAAVPGLSLLNSACTDPIVPGRYAAGKMWFCKPGQTSNRCLELGQTITYVYRDNRRILLATDFDAVVPAPLLQGQLLSRLLIFTP